MAEDEDACAALLRRQDPDRFFADLFAPAAARPHLFALHAFNVEVGRIREIVSDPLPGEIRLQWWRDVVNGLRPAEGAGHPVGAAIMATIEAFRLPVAAFDNLIEARIFDLYNDPMPSLNDLEGYAGETSSILFQLAAMILSGGNDPGTADAAGHAGVAYAITGLLRTLPIHARRRQLYLPADILDRHDVDRETIFAGQTTPALRAAIGELIEIARNHLASMRQQLANASAEVKPAFLPLALVEPMLGKLEAPSHDPLNQIAEIPQWQRQWRLWRAARSGV